MPGAALSSEIVYNTCINRNPHQALDPNNTQEIISDISGNLRQIGKWTLKGFRQQQANIALYLKLTRKNVATVSERTLSTKFQAKFDDFCREYGKLEKLYEKGITDHKEWAGIMQKLANDLDSASKLR